MDLLETLILRIEVSGEKRVGDGIFYFKTIQNEIDFVSEPFTADASGFVVDRDDSTGMERNFSNRLKVRTG